MACTKLSYQRLRNSPESSTQEEHQEHKNEAFGDQQQQKEEEEEEDGGGDEQEVVVKRSRSSRWLRLRSGGSKRWRRPRVRIAGLRRLLRRKAKMVGNAVRVSVTKVMTRLKQGKPFIGELFAGNYMFMQVSPLPTMSINSSYSIMDKLKLAKVNGFHHNLI